MYGNIEHKCSKTSEWNCDKKDGEPRENEAEGYLAGGDEDFEGGQEGEE